MDCQPVGEDGEVLISENKDGVPSIISGLSPEARSQFKSAVLIISLILLSVGFLCLILFGLPIAMRGLGWEESAEKVSKITSGIKAKIKNRYFSPFTSNSKTKLT